MALVLGDGTRTAGDDEDMVRADEVQTVTRPTKTTTPKALPAGTSTTATALATMTPETKPAPAPATVASAAAPAPLPSPAPAVTRRRKAQSSEVDAYVFIKENLGLLGWDTRNPARHPSGQVYTQSECLAHDEIKAAFGLEKPENVVMVETTVCCVIEAKRDHKQIEQAVKEAEDYATKINKHGGTLKAPFISGVAGNEIDGYLIRSKFLHHGKFVPIRFNEKEATSLISREVARTVLEHGPEVHDVPIDDALFLNKAERINEILHLGAINKDYRARVMAALLLALVDETPPNIDAKPIVLIQDINSRAEEVLRAESKVEFFEYVKLGLPTARDNHVKFKAALVQTIQELQNLNIRAAMNSGTDVLGKFYEVFLKYGNGAKEIGIVLTPRHVTKFAVETIGITDKDIVFDPCCGTGGFLIAAFDHVKQTHKLKQTDRFKQYGLFGVDQESPVVSLAIVNMIFRGDGKSNIVEGNAFKKSLTRTTRGGTSTARYVPEPPNDDDAPVTRVLMNPPFALKSSDEKEFRFVDHALAQMQDGGRLFAVLPYSAMAKSGEYQTWRENLLSKHTLLSVVTFPPDLFYPVSVHTLGIFVKKGTPHPAKQNVLWVRAIHDGLVKRKSKRLPGAREPNDIAKVLPLVQAFVNNPKHPVPNVLKFQKACPINRGDNLLELVPENYLDEAPPTDEEIRKGMEEVLRDALSYIIRGRRSDS